MQAPRRVLLNDEQQRAAACFGDGGRRLGVASNVRLAEYSLSGAGSAVRSRPVRLLFGGGGVGAALALAVRGGMPEF